ncbi:MAG: hypothetical protein IJT94_04655 [Oscillibacter sp.]|nr:hypothetical protein [Oscillibacter sp.]
MKGITLAQLETAVRRTVTSIASAVLEGLEEKADKPLRGTLNIPATGWGSDSTAGYPYYYDLAISGVTTSDRADVVVPADALAVAMDCELCPVTQTRDGYIRLRAASVPATAMTADYQITKG